MTDTNDNIGGVSYHSNVARSASQTEIGVSGSPNELAQLLGFIADTATALWRAQNSLEDKEPDHAAVMRRISRHIQSALDALHSAGIEIRQYSNEPYTVGMAVSVLAFQPTPGLERETVQETLKPSVFFKSTLIQRADLIVGVPEGGAPQGSQEPVNKSSEESTQ